MNATVAEVAAVLKTDETALEKRLEAIRKKLYGERAKRVRPHRDDKVLTDWNGLMIAAMARAARVLGDDVYGKAAGKAASFIMRRMRKDGRLLHRYREGDASFSGSLEDYAFLVWGLLELYELHFEPHHLKTAVELNEAMLSHFWDPERGGLFFSPDDGEKLLVRQKEVYDAAMPSGNSVAACNMMRLSRMTGDVLLEEHARELMRAFSAEIASFPAAHTHLLQALDMAIGPSREVVIVGEVNAPDTGAFLNAIRSGYFPNVVVLLRRAGEKGNELSDIAPYVKEMHPMDGKAAAYVCTRGSCKQPVADVHAMLELLGKQQ